MNFDQPIIPDDHLYREVNLGEKAKNFLKHDPLGRILADRALFEYKQAIFEFEGMGVAQILDNPQKVAEIKQKMDLSRSFILWVDDVIINATRAEEELHNRDMSDITID